MDIIAQIALNAVIAGAIYSLVALGFNNELVYRSLSQGKEKPAPINL
jgi:hypothetical protein